jgi:hypothetical protein
MADDSSHRENRKIPCKDGSPSRFHDKISNSPRFCRIQFLWWVNRPAYPRIKDLG